MTIYHWGMLAISLLVVVTIPAALSYAAVRYAAQDAIRAAGDAEQDVATCNRKISTHERQIASLTTVLSEIRRDLHYMGKSHDELKVELVSQRRDLDERMKDMSGKLDRLFAEGCARRCA